MKKLLALLLVLCMVLGMVACAKPADSAGSTSSNDETTETEEPGQEQNIPAVEEPQDSTEVQKTIWEMIVDWFRNLIDFIIGLFD